MLPEGIVIPDMEELTSETFKADFEANKLKGKIDELEAVKQAVFLILSTEYEYSEIYSGYGIKTVDLIGLDFDFVISELKRRIVNALLADERIVEVYNFTFSQVEEGALVEFDIKSMYGVLHAEEVYKV